jgi:16S rRNA (guanine527-N7)-methyltransferase
MLKHNFQNSETLTEPRSNEFEKLDGYDQEKLLKHLQAVIRSNNNQNLTRIDTVQSGALLHIEDSLAAVPEILEAKEGVLLDIGSGAGYPGIPLAVATKRKAVLVESNKNKAMFLEACIKECGLDEEVAVCNMRVEDYAKEAGEIAAIVTSRAVAETAVLLEYAAPILCIGGIVIAYKAQPGDAELANAATVAELLGFTQPTIKSFYLSDKITKRQLLIFVKTATAKIDLPRRAGMARKRPLYERCSRTSV